ncbi:MAG: biliverdin-producing heme oxygenase [Nitriliruptoraceae bacterium]
MTTAPEGFAARLRQATTPDHEQAESSSFMDGLLAGEVNLAAYHLLTRQHLELYRALEASADALRGDPVVAALHDPALERVPALLADLAWLRRERGVEVEEVLPATRRYADRIQEVAANWPGGYVAHHYTRYLGDLSGGLHLGRILAGQLAGGTTFYRFDGVPSPKRCKDAYRATLDAAPWDAGEQQRIVAEVSQAYAHNRAVLAALEQRAHAASVDTEMSVRHRGRRRAPAPGLVRDDARS